MNKSNKRCADAFPPPLSNSFNLSDKLRKTNDKSKITVKINSASVFIKIHQDTVTLVSHLFIDASPLLQRNIRRQFNRYLHFEYSSLPVIISESNIQSNQYESFMSFIFSLVTKSSLLPFSFVEMWDTSLDEGVGICTTKDLEVNRYHFKPSDSHSDSQHSKCGYCEFYDNNEIQSGDFKNDKLNGICKVDCSKFSIIGDFKDNDAHGICSSSFTNGYTCFGDYRRGKKNGVISACFKDGEVYYGGIQDNRKTGLAISKIRSVAEGIFQNNQLQGLVSIESPEGAMFVGQYHKQRPHGRGYIVKPCDCSLYEGEFSNGLYHGKGQLISLSPYNVVVHKGIFSEGDLKRS